MKKTFFTFKQFIIHQDLAAMKVCTDACLLGALAQFNTPTNLLDIGAGTGLLAFMLAQKYPKTSILAVEQEFKAIQQIEKNKRENPAFSNIQLFPKSIQELPISSVKFDGIVCNPPFYSDHLVSPDPSRALAHHQDTLTAETLAWAIDQFLDDQGTAWLMYPPHEMAHFLAYAAKKKWFPRYWIDTSHTPKHPINRTYIALQKNSSHAVQHSNFPIYQTDGQYHPTFRELLKEYYIIF